MTPSDVLQEAQALAASLEKSVQLATTRVEHIRVAAHATQARRIADGLLEALQPGQSAQTPSPVVFSAPERQ